MIYRPIYLGCDSCGIERAPTPDESRENLSEAYSRARDEGWAIRRNGEDIYCPGCMGVEVDVEVQVDIELELPDDSGVVKFSLVPLG